MYQDDIVLTLDYYLTTNVDQKQRAEATKATADVLNKACRVPWWIEMNRDYNSFADAVKQPNLKKVQDLINKGLNINSNLRGEPRTAIAYADAKGFTALAKLLESKGAQRKSPQELANHAKKQD